MFVVENLPVPFDRRVWQEARALRVAGWKVSVICPKTEKYPASREQIDGIEIYRHSIPLEARGRFAFVAEYVAALFHEARLLLQIFLKDGFDVIHACNPPDLIFLAAAPYKLLGKRFIFDHHDVSPELFIAKFGANPTMEKVLTFFEWLSFKTADLVISANDTFRDIALDRGGKKPDDVITVYSVPDRNRMRRVEPHPDITKLGKTILGYVGIIGDQDGVDHLVRLVDILKSKHGRSDFHAVIVGDGPALNSVKQLASSLGLDDEITFTGYKSGEELLKYLSTFEIGIIPDPVNVYNDKISMNKVFEYSALGIPSVTYPLTETTRLLRGTSSVSENDQPEGLAKACLTLLDDTAKRTEMGRRAQKLADEHFDWDHEAAKLRAAYDRFFPATAGAEVGEPEPLTDR